MLPRLLALTLLAASSLAGQQRPPSDSTGGRGILERMHAAYAGRWYTSLAFVQKTTIVRPGGQVDTATWYESLKGPDLLRIDFGDPAGGGGAILTAESTFVFRGGLLARSRPEGNPFLPLIMGVYLQPVDVTARGAAHHGVDVTKAYPTTWDGRPVYVVGAASAADTSSPQLWIDAERLLLVRMRIVGASAGAALDVRLDDYVPVGRGWLATRVTVLRDGARVQSEEYTEWSTAVAIPDSLFERQRWVTGGHWATAARPAALWQRHP